MKNTVYHLGTCSTCVKIINQLDLGSHATLHDIKKEPISEAVLEELGKMAGSFEALFSKRAMLYKQRNLKEKSLKETDFKELILEHYTFLKRPVTIYNGEIFIGNSPKEVERLGAALRK